MSKLATMAGLITDSERKPPGEHHRHQKRSQTPDRLRPPPGSRHYSSLSRSRSVTVGSASSHPISKSKATKLVVDSLQRRHPQPADSAAGIMRRNKSVRSRGKKSSKLRSIISFVFAGHRRRRSSSLSSISTLSSSSRSSARLRSSMRKLDSNSNSNFEDDEIGGKYSSLSLSSSSESSGASIGGRKEGSKKKKKREVSGGENRGKTVNNANFGGGKLSRGNSVRRNGIVGEGEKRFELCKLKILMGGKCKPLNESGKLHYDEDGVIVPEPLPP